MFTPLIIIGAMLGLIGGVLMFRSGRRLEEEAKRIGYDFFSRDYAINWLRPEKLPESMRPFAKQARLTGMLTLWPAFILMCVAFFLS